MSPFIVLCTVVARIVKYNQGNVLKQFCRDFSTYKLFHYKWDIFKTVYIQNCEINEVVAYKSIYCRQAEFSQPAVKNDVFIPLKTSNHFNSTAIKFPNSMRWYAFPFRVTEVLKHILS